jgi:ribosomal-protein-alanine N-acetyltransferase
MPEGMADKLADLVIEKMSIWDVDEVVAIERANFPMPWSSQSFINDIYNSRSLCFVTRVEGKLAGYAVAWFVPGEMHIGNIAVEQDSRRKGIGSKLLSCLLEFAKEKKMDTVSLEVRASNIPAISLYRKFGFKEVAVRRKYYRDENEDAIVMLLRREDFSFDGR